VPRPDLDIEAFVQLVRTYGLTTVFGAAVVFFLYRISKSLDKLVIQREPPEPERPKPELGKKPSKPKKPKR
jgi:hypothetical protein